MYNKTYDIKTEYNVLFLFRYMSIHDNKFLKYFTGHTAKVVSLSLSPVDDTIISSSLDKTVSKDLER